MNSKDVSRLQKIAQSLFFSPENIEDLELKRRQTSVRAAAWMTDRGGLREASCSGTSLKWKSYFLIKFQSVHVILQATPADISNKSRSVTL